MANGNKSQVIENCASALKRATDEQFDYKDFNFIVTKNRQPQPNFESQTGSNGGIFIN